MTRSRPPCDTSAVSPFGFRPAPRLAPPRGWIVSCRTRTTFRRFARPCCIAPSQSKDARSPRRWRGNARADETCRNGAFEFAETLVAEAEPRSDRFGTDSRGARDPSAIGRCAPAPNSRPCRITKGDPPRFDSDEISSRSILVNRLSCVRRTRDVPHALDRAASARMASRPRVARSPGRLSSTRGTHTRTSAASNRRSRSCRALAA